MQIPPQSMGLRVGDSTDQKSRHILKVEDPAKKLLERGFSICIYFIGCLYVYSIRGD